MSFAKLSHKLSQLKAKFGDKLYQTIYYGLMPTIIVVGRCCKLLRSVKKAQERIR